jgi:hypothetical protein
MGFLVLCTRMQPKKTACIPEVREERDATSSASITVSHPLAITATPSDSLNDALIETLLEGGKTTCSGTKEDSEVQD